MIEKFFKNYQIDFNKLIEYGFKKSGNIYTFEKQIVDNQFTLKFFVDNLSVVSTKIIDNSTNEEYILHLMDDVGGEFVGRVRSEYLNALNDIKEKCFKIFIFNSVQAQKVTDYIKNKYGDELEFLWPKFSNNAIWRRKDNKKWYCLIISLPKNKLKLKGNETAVIIDVRISEEDLKMIDNVSIFEAYHMNKLHWITLLLDSNLSDNQIFNLIDNSYNLANKK